jgi:two-component system, LytTR family, response regulator
MITTLIVDDERLAREGIRIALKPEADVKIVGEAADGPSALKAIVKLAPDLAFLDIRMPGLSGFEVLDRVTQSGARLPIIVFVTAFDQYAVRAFETHALDYLLKPVEPKRVLAAVQRARAELAREGLGDTPVKTDYLERVAVRERDRFVLIKMHEVDWIESAANYLQLHARSRSYMLRMTIGELEERLDTQRFVRIHRSTIVNIDRLVEVRPSHHGDFNVILNDGTILRMSRGFRDNLLPRCRFLRPSHGIVSDRGSKI